MRKRLRNLHASLDSPASEHLPLLMFAPNDFFDLNHTEHQKLFEGGTYVWDALKQIANYLRFRMTPAIEGRMVGKPFISDSVFIGKGTVVEQGAMVKGPAWIGEDCEIRNGCYIRENVIVGNGVVMGNSCEFKNCIILDEAEIPHFNYVGDSILGYKSHLGAGVILSNVRLDRAEIVVMGKEGAIATGMKKFGAIVGDHTEIGCNSVISPGSLLGRNCIIYPGTQFRGVVPDNRIVKFKQDLDVIQRRG